MYSDGLHIIFVEANKKVNLLVDSMNASEPLNNFELELITEIIWMLGEVMEGIEIENSEHDGLKFDKDKLQKFGYYND